MDLDQRIVYINADGTIGIITPVDCGLTIEEIATKDVPTGLTYHIVDKSEIPTDRTFREAWKWQ